MNPCFRLLAACALLSGSLIQHAAVAQTAPVIRSFGAADPDVFLGGRGTFLFDVGDADVLEIDQGVGVVRGDSARFSQTENVYLLPRRSAWSYLADGSDRGASDVVAGGETYDSMNWKHPDFDDTAWMSGAGEFGYGDSPDTDVGYVDVDLEAIGTQKNATTYYRTRFELGAERSSQLGNLFLELRRDDGAIVYLNGAEIARMNVGDGVLDHDTYVEDLGHSIAGNAGETTYFECELDPSLLAVGTNTLAVEIHQAHPRSSDTRFDLGLFEKVTGARGTVFPTGSLWRVNDRGENFGDAAIVAGHPSYDTNSWKHPGFDDAAWPERAGDFGYDEGVISESTILRFGPNEDNADNDPDDKFLAYYFRADFELAPGEVTGIATAIAHLRADDGAIIYVNGAEIARETMGEGVVTSASTAGVGGVNEKNYDAFVFDPAVLVEGTNIVAVEVHQGSRTSSDVSFDMDITLTDSADVVTTKIPRGSTWSYLDDGGASLGDGSSSALVAGAEGYGDTNWKHPLFDDSAWRSGEGELGYGDTDLTIGGHLRQSFTSGLSFGDDPEDKHVTTYFRRQFDVAGADLAAAFGAQLIARVDDGAIAYLNGVEVWRSNLPANPDPDDPDPDDPVDGATPARNSVAADGKSSEVVDLDERLLVAGVNTIAVELHQNSPTTSDAVFDMALQLVHRGAAPTVTYTLTASNEFGSDTATATVTTVRVPEAPVYLSNANGTGVAWNFPEVWSDKSAPHPGRYVGYGQFDAVIRTPAGIDDPVFGGTSLDLVGGTALLRVDHLSGTASIAEIVLDGGRIENHTERDLAIGGAGGSIVVRSSSTIGTDDDGSLTVSADVSGSATLSIIGDDAASVFTGDNSTFTGTWQVDGVISPASSTSLGTGAITIGPQGTLAPGIEFFDPLPNTLNLSAGGTLDLNRTIAFPSAAVSIGGTLIEDGTYTAAELNALGLGGNFLDGRGYLHVGATGADVDGDSLPDAWERMFFNDLESSDGVGDADGDGQSDGAEFAAGTDPVDVADVFAITSITQSGAGELSLMWPSKTGRNYGVRRGDLASWEIVAGGLAGTGGEMSFTDGGALAAGEERHYQVFVE